MKISATLLAIYLLPLFSFSIAGPVGEVNNWMKEPKDLTDLSQFPASAFDTTQRPVPDSVIKAYGLEFTPDNTRGAAIFGNDDVNSAAWPTKCETSGGSPVSWHLQVAINWLRARGQTQCMQWRSGNTCSEMIGFLTARIGVCGEYRYWLWCDSAAGFTNALLEQCRNNLGGDDRTGGYTIIRGWPGSGDFRGMVVY